MMRNLLLLTLAVCCVGAAPRDCRFGKRCVFPCRCKNGGACNRETGECGAIGCEVGHLGHRWKGAACQEGNIAYGKQTSQSDAYGDMMSDRAIDGQLASNESEYNCARVLNANHKEAEWRVDLGQQSVVKSFLVYSTFDTEGASTLTNVSFSVVGQQGKVRVCNRFTGRAPMGYMATLQINCIPPAIGTRAVIKRFGKVKVDRMTLCEVLVIGYRYITCSHCPGKCDNIRGCQTCPPGKRLPDCTRPCLAGFYGDNCQYWCERCRAGSTCKPTDGHCLFGCKAGWYGDRCNNQEGSAGENPPTRSTVTGYPSYSSPKLMGTGPILGRTIDNITNPQPGRPYPGGDRGADNKPTNLTDSSSVSAAGTTFLHPGYWIFISLWGIHL